KARKYSAPRVISANIPMPDLSLPALTLADFATLAPNRTVMLTVNNRLARRLTLELTSGLSSPQTLAQVMPWRVWFDILAENRMFGDPAALAGNRLDDFGARLLWRRVIENETTGLLDTFEAARLAADARHLM